MRVKKFLACVAPLTLLVAGAAGTMILHTAPNPSAVFGGQEREPVVIEKTKDCQTACEEAGGACPAGTLCVSTPSTCEESKVWQSAKCVEGTRFESCKDPGSDNCQETRKGTWDPESGTCSCTTPTAFCGVKQACTGG